MHIAFLTSEYPHQRIQHAAGIGTSIKNLVAALTNKGIAVSVFVYGQKEDEIFMENSIKIHLIQVRRYRFLTWFQYRKYIQNYLNQYVNSDKIDLIEAPDWTGITAFMNLKVPLVVRFHGSDAYFCHLEKRKQKFKNFLFEKFALSKACAYIAPTDYAGKLTQQIFKIKNKPIKTIHYGLRLSQFENPKPHEFHKGRILYIGTIIRKKGVFELPAILEKVLIDCPEAHLVMIGGDSPDFTTQSVSTWKLLHSHMNHKLKAKIQYLGKVPYQYIQEHIKNANLCVFPTFAETLGMVTIESMAMQKAVVNSNMGWSKELIDDEINGYLVDPEDHALYAAKIVKLLQNEKLCFDLGKAARKRVEKYFDIEKLVIENIAFYNEIIKTNENDITGI